MSGTVLSASLGSGTVERVLPTLLRGLTVVAFLGVGLAAAHLLVRALRGEGDRLRDRDARLVLVGSGVLFATGFVRVAAPGGVPHAGTAAVAPGFAGVTYLLYVTRPALFEFPGRNGGEGGPADEGSDAPLYRRGPRRGRPGRGAPGPNRERGPTAVGPQNGIGPRGPPDRRGGAGGEGGR